MLECIGLCLVLRALACGNRLCLSKDGVPMGSAQVALPDSWVRLRLAPMVSQP